MKKRALLFVAIGAAVLFAGGFFAYRMFFSEKTEVAAEAKSEDKKGHEKDAAKGGEHAEKGGGGGHGGAAPAASVPGMGPTVPLEPFVVNLSDPGRSRYAKIVAQLEVDADQTAAAIDGLKPKVRDALLMLFSSKTSEEMVTVGGKETLRNEIIRRVNGLLLSGKVVEVYFTEFVVQ